MSDTLVRVLDIVARHSGVPLVKLTAHSALDQDVRISGDDVDELAEMLANEFGADTANWPWQRYVDLNEPHLFTGIYFIWRLFTWPFRGRIFDPSPYERLELGHIAAVIEKGEWFDP